MVPPPAGALRYQWRRQLFSFRWRRQKSRKVAELVKYVVFTNCIFV